MRCSLDEANKSIELRERRTHEEYDSSEEKISAMLAKIKNRHEMEFQKFKEESEAAYENGVQNCDYNGYPKVRLSSPLKVHERSLNLK